MAIGLGEGQDKAQKAIYQALHHPLLEINSLEQATGILVHFTGGDELTLYEVGEAINELRATLSPKADLIMGASTEPSMAGRTQVILIVTGIGAHPIKNVPHPQNQKIPAETQIQGNTELDDLDVPAFLRKRLTIG